jgi:protein tyrosine phosphatase (PTP) superfamily phosphohydrolase (DUF442 family)
MHRWWTLGAIAGLLLPVGCGEAPLPANPDVAARRSAEPLSAALEDAPADFAGLHNVVRVSAKLLSGGAPEGDEGFDSLQRLGVKTIISVDGARPDLQRARRVGMRYVHLPIGYDGVPREQALKLARAVRDLPGQVYLHCHHGKHRSPAAAVAANLCLDGACTSGAALALMKRAGTGANYKGLHAAAEQFHLVSNEELDRVSADFPEVAQTDDFVNLMVKVERHFDHLKQVRAAGWQAPPEHADLDGPHEALLLREAYAELARLKEAKERGDELERWLAEAADNAGALETALAAGKQTGSLNSKAVEAAFNASADACARCHRKYRDVPQR